MTNMCEGEPRFDSGKFHNHCVECPGFGMCIYDYREAHCDRWLLFCMLMTELSSQCFFRCGHHYFAGNTGFSCSNCKRKRRQARFKDPEYMKKFAMFLVGQGEKPSDSDDSDEDFF